MFGIKNLFNKTLLVKVKDFLICIFLISLGIVPFIKKSMSDVSSGEHHLFSIPLTVDVNKGNNWGEAH